VPPNGVGRTSVSGHDSFERRSADKRRPYINYAVPTQAAACRSDWPAVPAPPGRCVSLQMREEGIASLRATG